MSVPHGDGATSEDTVTIPLVGLGAKTVVGTELCGPTALLGIRTSP